MPRWSRWLLLGGSTLLAAGIGAADAALRTEAGREVVTHAAVDAANNAIDGRVTVGAIEGSLRDGLEARDVTVEGRDGVVMMRIPELLVRYRLSDLLRGRVVLGRLTLSGPYVDLIESPGGRLNAEDILGLGKPSSGTGWKPLVAFSDVVIRDGTLCLRTLADSAATAFERDGPYRVRRVEGINARLPYLRLSSPLEAERSVRIDIADLRARLNDPRLDIRGAEGLAEIMGDTVRLDLTRAALPGSRAAVKGTLSWHGGRLTYDLGLNSRHVAVDDVRGLAPRLPRGLEAEGAFTVRTSEDGTVFELESEAITVRGTGGGGSFAGRLGLALGPGLRWAASRTSITLDGFDLEYVRPILDTLPIAGRLSGSLKADGPSERLAVELDWAFRDSLVAGRPESRVRARGEVAIGVPGGFAFRGLSVAQARIDLGTVRRILPAIVLRGVVAASGSITGPWLEPEFSGTLRHRHSAAPPSVARGVIRLDARRDTIGVWANLAWDSLSVDGLHSAFPSLPLSGAFAGETRLSGYADSLELGVDLAGPAGRIGGGATVTLVSPHVAVRGLDLALHNLTLDRLHPRLPPSAVFGRVSGLVDLDSLAAPVVRLAVTLDSTMLAGSLLDSLRATVGGADSLIRLERFDLWAPAARIAARGGLAVRGGARTDSLLISVDADPFRDSEPFVRWLLNLAPDTALGGPVGGVHLRATVAGGLDDFRISGEATMPRIEWGGLRVARARARGEWRSSAAGAVGLTLSADSAGFAGYTLHRLDGAAAGRRDSLGWRLTARLGDSARVDAAGRAHRDSLALAIPLDSLRVSLPVHVWRAGPGATVLVSDSELVFDRAVLGSADGAAQVEVSGAFPLAGSGNLHVRVVQVPLRDLLASLQRRYATVGGTLSGNLDLNGTAAEPVMAGAFSLVEWRFGDFRVPQMEGSIGYRERRLTGEFALRRLGVHLLNLQLDLPLDLALKEVESRQVDGSLLIRGVADSVDLALAEALTPEVRAARGRFDADIGVTGTWRRPELAGVLSVVGGSLSLPSVGVRYENVNGRFALVADTIKLQALRVESAARGGKGPRGSLDVGGYVRLEELSRPVLALSLSARDFQLLDVRSFLSAAVTGQLALRGPVVGATLTGRGSLTRGVLYFADLITKQVVNLQDTLFSSVLEDTSLVRRQGLGPAFHNIFWDSLRIENLTAEMGSDVWMRSNEANIQLDGTINISKVATVYRLDGSLNARRGTYKLAVPLLLTKEFDVTRGQVRYFGTPDLNAGLDIDARYVVRRLSDDDVNVFVHLGGTLYDPRLTLSTDARTPLGDAQIIQLLLGFGTRGQAQAQSQSELVLARLGTVLSYGSDVVANQFEGALGALASSLNYPLDYVDVTAGSFTGTQITLGKQVFPNLFVTVSPRMCAPSGQPLFTSDNLGASLEFRFSRDWRLAASMDPVGTCGVTGARAANVGRQIGADLFWEKRF